ncbi:MAG: flagellar type III secretion system pore protein FliP [Proteobacteria bacterium]|nr:flagellar type III secretion system pore protein FliP [Pseudomonadota bacterium]
MIRFYRQFGFLLALPFMAGLAFAQATTQAPAPGPQQPALQLLDTLTGSTSDTIIQSLVLITLLSIAPGIAVMVTSFTRIVIAFSFLRTSIGLQTTPANLVMISLAMFLTMFIMAPTFDQAWREGLQPLMEKRISEAEAYDKMTDPFREFMLKNVQEKELVFFQNMAAESSFGTEASERDLRILVPAFMVSELRRGFEIGFLIALPFLIIDLVVATVTMSMGMMMLPPTVVSLPFKVLFFVLVDGWTLLIGSLVRSFH